MLGVLQNNGGPTQTQALAVGSPALLAGSNPQNYATDQRGPGFVRQLGSAPDMGAYEDQPHVSAVTDATTTINTQTTSGLIITTAGGETDFFQITNITNGTLYQNDGTTPITDGEFITIAQGEAGLKFTPAQNSNATGSFTVQASLTSTVGGPGGDTVTATILVNLFEPEVTNATTDENVQTTSGLVITPQGSGTNYFQITKIINGTLFQNDGVTQINDGDFISVAQGAAGLKFTPDNASDLQGSFDVQASTDDVSGVSGDIVTATINVTPVAYTPAVTNATTNEDVQTSSGLVITPNSNNGPELQFFQITGITGGTLFSNNGLQINNGDFISVAEGAAGLKFTPANASTAAGSFGVQASVADDASGLGGQVVTATITVVPVVYTPSVTNSSTTEDTQTTTGLVITPSSLNGPEVQYFQITGITGGTLYLNDGVTAINNGEFITVAEGAAGLKFTPTPDSTGPGAFSVQASFSNTAAGLGGQVVNAAITVYSSAVTISSATTAAAAFNGQPVSFIVAVTAPQGEALTYYWDFGDGSFSTSASPSHTYLQAGTYSVTVTVTGASGVGTSYPFNVNVAIATLPDGSQDSHGYGVSDAVWNAAGGDPFGADVHAPAAQDLTIGKIGIKLNFAKPVGNDSIQVSGALQIPAGFNPANQSLILDVGGVATLFVLDDKGNCKNSAGTFKLTFKSVKGLVAAQTAKFSAALNKGSFQTALANQGLTDATVSKAGRNVWVGVYFNLQIFAKVQTVSYTAKHLQSGSAK
jgi:PKD repeat protein